MILLDTNVVVAHLNGAVAVTAKISSHIEDIAVPALVVAELDYGAKASARPAENLARLSTFLQCVEVVGFDEAAAHQYGTLRAHLRTIGKPTGEIDALIAAVVTRHTFMWHMPPRGTLVAHTNIPAVPPGRVPGPVRVFG